MENKKRLIDADEFRQRATIPMTKIFPDWKKFSTETREALAKHGKALKHLLDEIPTVDAVEVVRCKDCNFWRRCGETNKGECDGMDVYGLLNADDYCSNGERKSK